MNKDYLLVDGYNIIFAWKKLNKLAEDNIEAAKDALINMLCNYQGVKKMNLILVFDAYKVAGGQGSVEKQGGANRTFATGGCCHGWQLEPCPYGLEPLYHFS